jgi:hypothetical protein
MRIALCLTGLIGNLEGKSYDMGNGTQKVLDICYEKIKKHINNISFYIVFKRAYKKFTFSNGRFI